MLADRGPIVRRSAATTNLMGPFPLIPRQYQALVRPCPRIERRLVYVEIRDGVLSPLGEEVADAAVLLGSAIDAEVDGNPDSVALGDDSDRQPDEDGVAIIIPPIIGDSAAVATVPPLMISSYALMVPPHGPRA